MNDHIRDAFDRLMVEVREPPTWEDLTSPAVVPLEQRPVHRRRGVWAAAAAFSVVLIGVVVAAILIPPADVAVAVEIDHLQLAWNEELTVRCDGMETEDGGGFDGSEQERRCGSRAIPSCRTGWGAERTGAVSIRRGASTRGSRSRTCAFRTPTAARLRRSRC